MKIVFICGSFERSKDGVGDYTRIIALETAKLGHECSILAIMDRYIDSPVNESLKLENYSMEILRLPFSKDISNNSIISSGWIKKINPDWISLQFVPYAFNNKGLLFGFSKEIKRLVGNYKFQIMFHELWSGMNTEAPLKLKLMGLLQKRQLLYFMNSTKPDLLHTHNKLYQMQLNSLGFKAHLLPLFSNIKVSGKLEGNKSNTLGFVVFGSIHPGAPIRQFAKQLANYAIENNLNPMITFIGKCGEEQNIWVSVLTETGIKIRVLGPQPEEIISAELHDASFGITTTPVLLSEKSGSVAAMLMHNLPVICVSKSWKPRNIDAVQIPYGILEYKSGVLPDFKMFKKSLVPVTSNSSENVARQFVSTLMKNDQYGKC